VLKIEKVLLDSWSSKRMQAEGKHKALYQSSREAIHSLNITNHDYNH
jgi:hypothetical protein